MRINFLLYLVSIKSTFSLCSSITHLNCFYSPLENYCWFKGRLFVKKRKPFLHFSITLRKKLYLSGFTCAVFYFFNIWTLSICCSIKIFVHVNVDTFCWSFGKLLWKCREHVCHFRLNLCNLFPDLLFAFSKLSERNAVTGKSL